MKIKLELTESLYNAAICIEDAYGRRDFILHAMEEQGVQSTQAEVATGSFTMTIMPLFSELKETMREAATEAKGWKEKLAVVVVEGVVGVTKYVPLNFLVEPRSWQRPSR